ncbi:uncharacterized protein LOC111352755 isoform X1 [Spodoptera litura]|uniref:Uncharacterized protein LOC111352755 isoform X1 n=1 Tax=Spodoptera litura TaxID=69820 RepID=A0A9J7DZH6_SPOLT|nr:uncharacterized protein LOC111352755 isoform X1 [Spodoptera litura]
MRTTSFSLEVLALLFLTLIPWPGPSVFKITCSRDNSKIVRKVIENKWLPVLERFQVKLPLECPFHPARDIFAPQHAAKLQHRPSQWTCAFCGKSFYEERHLDTHFDQRHKNQINKAEDAVCLADYCDIMRCQVLVAHGLLSGTGGPSTDIENLLQVWQDVESVKKALAPAATRSVARVNARRRHRARTAPPPPIEDCPRSEADAREQESEPEEKRTEDNDSDANQTAELCDADTVESSLPPDSRHKRLADLQAERAACDPTRLQTLKIRCERIVHSCIATLLLHLTQHQFTELEEEMQRAVCWYLSCDRYWEDTAPSARAFPWPLLLALATGLALALCMCYYIIWIVFELPYVQAFLINTMVDHLYLQEAAEDFPEPRSRRSSSEEGSVAGSASVSMTTHSSPTRGERLAADDAMLDDPDHDDHYIYVTYPPELKRRLLESCYNRTTRL